MDKKFLIVLIATVVVVGGLAYYVGTQQGIKQGFRQGEAKGYEAGKKDTEASYQELIAKAQTPAVNPIENLPSTNPFEEVKVNPFADVQTNPFK